MGELQEYWEQYIDYFNSFIGWYNQLPGVMQRFMKYGGWISLQFWVVRAPMTVFLTNVFPETIRVNLFIHLFEFPGYLLASFTSGTLLAIVGFFISEGWIWRKKVDAV